MKKENLLKVYLAAMAYSLITGFSFVFTKFALEFSDPITILAHRFTSSFILLLIVMKLNKGKFRFNLKTIKELFPIAIVYPLLFFTFQTFGLKHSSSSEAGILLATAPIFTLILSKIFLKEEHSNLQKFSVLLSVLGVSYIFYMKSLNLDSSGNTNFIGIILLTLTALSFAVYSILSKKYNKKYTNFEIIAVMITISFIGFNLLFIINSLKNNSFNLYIAPLFSLKYIISILYLGLLSSFLTSFLTNYVLQTIEASKMSVFANLGTVISIVAGALILGEEIQYYHIIGSILIIIGVIGTNYQKKKEI